ncbi:MAG: hypothetical protein JNM81_17115 [Rhodospirillaceae bacterium]|nr:hypothetical protein [Rhodospirillaceae bacterium]
MTDPYAVGLSADKLWSAEELCAAHDASSGPRGAYARRAASARDIDLGLMRHGVRIAVSFGTLCILLLTIYALSPGGIESVLNTLAIAGLTLAAVFLVRVWDELRLLWSQNRGQNPAKGADKAKLR